MKNQKRPIVVGNWKMNPASIVDAKHLLQHVLEGMGRNINKVDVVVAVPFPYIFELSKLTKHKKIEIGAQHVHYEKSGRHTGEVSTLMLKSVGATHVIVGHSERRAEGETDEQVQKTLFTVAKAGLTAVLCIGEKKRDSKGNHFNVVEQQFQSAFKEFPKGLLGRVVIAYEPVWAISSGNGKGKTATPADVLEMKLFIQKMITDRFGRPALQKIRIIYGGSANPDNTEVLLTEGTVDGFLPGGASLKPKEFVAIINTTQHYADTQLT